MGLLIKTPVGNIVHTSDFKFDNFPVNEKPTDFKKLESIAENGIHLLMCDSTGAEEPGHSLSEKDIFENMDKIFAGAKGRIIIATFSSLINRIQQAVTLSEKYNRKVGFIGHSMKSNVEVTKKLGYLKSQKGTLLKKVAEVNDLPDNQVTILCTGAQGEENAGLMKIATGEHQSIKIKPGDTIVFSSSVIPGNERSVQILKDDFIRQKANVFHYKMMDIHAGGHAQRDEIKEIVNIMKPKFFMPIHGQFSMLFANARLVEDECGYKEDQTILADNGNIINITKDKVFIDNKSVSAEYIMVDGLGIGDVGEVVFGNVGTMIAFRVGAEDGEFLEKEFSPEFYSTDLVNLSKQNIYVKLMIDGLTSRPFSAETLPPAIPDNGYKDEIIEFSRNKYGKDREIIEKEISKYTGVVEEKKEVKKETKNLFDAECQMCGKKIKVPFEPDDKRPVYCKTCLGKPKEINLEKVAKDFVPQKKENKIDLEGLREIIKETKQGKINPGDKIEF
jgi:CxxC-x17-CxxC domain-containing protein